MAEYELPSEEELKENYKKAKEEWAEDKDLGIHSLAGKLNGKYGDFENRILIKKAGGLKLDGKEKAADLAINKITPLAADTSLGIIVGKALEHMLKKGITPNIKLNNAKRLAKSYQSKKATGVANVINNGTGKKYLSKNDFKEMLELAESIGADNKSISSLKHLINNPEDYQKEEENIGSIRNFWLYNYGRIDKVDGKDPDPTDTLLRRATDKENKIIDNFTSITSNGLGNGIMIGTLPISNISKKFEQERLIKAKKLLVKKILAKSNSNIDADKMTNEEIENFIKQNKKLISDWLNCSNKK